MLLSLRGYARHRNTWLISVQRAIAAGRIEKTADGKIDTDEADPKWDQWEAERHGPAGAPLLDAVPDLEPLNMSKEPEPLPARVGRPEPASPSADVCKREERISEDEARRRKEIALARLREMEVAEKERRLVPADQIESAWTAVAGKIKDAVLRIPDKCAPAVVAAADVQEARAVLMIECEGILRALHDDLLRP